MAPMMAGITTGTMVGRLALRSLGTYDLPIPRDGDELLVVVPNVEAFAADWSLPAADLRLWICLHEVAHHAVLGVPHLRAALTDLLTRHAGAFRNDGSALQDQLGDIDLTSGPEALARLQESLNPEMVLGAVRSPEQEALLPYLEALVAVVIGYVDHVMDDIGSTLIGSYRQVTEAARRRRVGTGDADRFVERQLQYGKSRSDGLDMPERPADRHQLPGRHSEYFQIHIPAFHAQEPIPNKPANAERTPADGPYPPNERNNITIPNDQFTLPLHGEHH
jgi:putative hydrolase